MLLAGQIARLTTIRFALLAPFLFMMIAFAAFQSRMSFGDLVALIFVGIIGILLRRFDYSRPAFLIGFVLSTQAEQFVNMATQVGSARFRTSLESGIDYLVSPISVTLLVLSVLSIVIGIRQSKNIRENIVTHTGTKRAPMLFLGAITLYVAISTIDAAGVSRFGDKVFPLTIGIVTLLGCLALMARMILRPETDDVFIDMETGGDDGNAPYSLWGTLGWFFGLLALTALFGFIIALAIFLLTFFRIRAQVSWSRTLILTAAAIALICVLAGSLGRDFPPGLLQEFVALPWPLT